LLAFIYALTHVSYIFFIYGCFLSLFLDVLCIIQYALFVFLAKELIDSVCTEASSMFYFFVFSLNNKNNTLFS